MEHAVRTRGERGLRARHRAEVRRDARRTCSRSAQRRAARVDRIAPSGGMLAALLRMRISMRTSAIRAAFVLALLTPQAAGGATDAQVLAQQDPTNPPIHLTVA